MKIGTWNTCGAIGPSRAGFLRGMDLDIWAFQECEVEPDLGRVDKRRTQRRIETISMKPRKLSAVLS